MHAQNIHATESTVNNNNKYKTKRTKVSGEILKKRKRDKEKAHFYENIERIWCYYQPIIMSLSFFAFDERFLCCFFSLFHFSCYVNRQLPYKWRYLSIFMFLRFSKVFFFFDFFLFHSVSGSTVEQFKGILSFFRPLLCQSSSPLPKILRW